MLEVHDMTICNEVLDKKNVTLNQSKALGSSYPLISSSQVSSIICFNVLVGVILTLSEYDVLFEQVLQRKPGEANTCPPQCLHIILSITTRRSQLPEIGKPGSGNVNSSSVDTKREHLQQLTSDCIRLDADKQYPHLISCLLKQRVFEAVRKRLQSSLKQRIRASVFQPSATRSSFAWCYRLLNW